MSNTNQPTPLHTARTLSEVEDILKSDKGMKYLNIRDSMNRTPIFYHVSTRYKTYLSTGKLPELYTSNNRYKYSLNSHYIDKTNTNNDDNITPISANKDINDQNTQQQQQQREQQKREELLDKQPFRSYLQDQRFRLNKDYIIDPADYTEDDKIVLLLLQNNKEIFSPDIDRHSPLYYADTVHLLHLLISRQLEYMYMSTAQRNPKLYNLPDHKSLLIHFISLDNYDIVNYLCQYYQCDVYLSDTQAPMTNMSNTRGYQPNVFDINIYNNIISSIQSVDMIKLLILYKMDISLYNFSNVEYCKSIYNIDIAKYLIDNNAQIVSPVSPLHYVQSYQIAKLLIDSKCNIENIPNTTTTTTTIHNNRTINNNRNNMNTTRIPPRYNHHPIITMLCASSFDFISCNNNMTTLTTNNTNNNQDDNHLIACNLDQYDNNEYDIDLYDHYNDNVNNNNTLLEQTSLLRQRQNQQQHRMICNSEQIRIINLLIESKCDIYKHKPKNSILLNCKNIHVLKHLLYARIDPDDTGYNSIRKSYTLLTSGGIDQQSDIYDNKIILLLLQLLSVGNNYQDISSHEIQTPLSIYIRRYNSCHLRSLTCCRDNNSTDTHNKGEDSTDMHLRSNGITDPVQLLLRTNHQSIKDKKDDNKDNNNKDNNNKDNTTKNNTTTNNQKTTSLLNIYNKDVLSQCICSNDLYTYIQYGSYNMHTSSYMFLSEITHYNILSLLYDNGLDINTYDLYGNTLIHYIKDILTLQCYLYINININQQNINNAKTLAHITNNQYIAYILYLAGADMNIIDNNNNTPITCRNITKDQLIINALQGIKPHDMPDIYIPKWYTDNNQVILGRVNNENDNIAKDKSKCSIT